MSPDTAVELTMTRRQLWLLVVLALQLVSNRVEQLHVALFRILCQSSDEGLADCIGDGCRILVTRGLTYDMAPVALPASDVSALVCESLQPDHMMTSAGEVLVCLVRSAASELEPMTDLPIL